MAHIIVFGNEKGGSGKSTTAMHTATALARQGARVGVIDLDLRQRSLERYVENRAEFAARQGVALPMPTIGRLPKVDADALPEGESPFDRSLTLAVDALAAASDFVVVDCPGSHSRLSQMAHSLADTLVTPLNDSFVDFDMLARIDAETQVVRGPSVYAEMVWSARQLRARAGRAPTDWIVLRNRLGTTEMHNKRKVGAALDDLARRIGFRVAPGFTERVIFRELFPRGMTLLDLKDIGVGSLSLSNVAARQEVRELLASLRLPRVEAALQAPEGQT